MTYRGRLRWQGSREGQWEWDGMCNSSFVQWSTHTANGNLDNYVFMAYNFWGDPTKDGFVAQANQGGNWYIPRCGCEVEASMPTQLPSVSPPPSTIPNPCQDTCFGYSCTWWDKHFGSDPFR